MSRRFCDRDHAGEGRRGRMALIDADTIRDEAEDGFGSERIRRRLRRDPPAP